MIQGKWYSQDSASYQEAFLSIETTTKTYTLYTTEAPQDQEPLHSGTLESLEVSDRLGNIERKITLADGSTFMTHDNDSVDRLFKKKNRLKHFIHTLESHLGAVAIALVVTLAFSFGFFRWGIPWISYKIAHALPQSTNTLISGHTLSFLDEYVFEESELNSSQQAAIKAHFQKNIVPLDSSNQGIIYKLHFREWYDGTSIPNALALPSGDIILTDQFVKLCKNQDEMDAVLLHEMGHIAHRHSLQMIIQSTFVTVVVMLVAGDSNGLADMGIGLGSLLVSSHYSRDHESDADKYAFEKMLIARKDPKHFSNIMNRITHYMYKEHGLKEEEIEERQKNKEKQMLDYLSTHPQTSERVDIANQYSECFKKGLTICHISPHEDTSTH